MKEDNFIQIEETKLPESKKNSFYNSRRIFGHSGSTLRKGSFETKNYGEGQGWSLGRFGASLNHIIDPNDSSVDYSGGTWAEENSNTLYYSTRMVSSTVGDYFEINFTGDYIGLVFEKASNVGKINVSIDGGANTLVDLYSTTLRIRNIAHEVTGLSPGKHIAKITVATKNASSSANGVNFNGYTLNSGFALKLQNLDCELYAYAVSVTLTSNGYAAFASAAPSGYTVYNIVGMNLSTSAMSDATMTEPKLCWRVAECYVYNGAPDTTYTVTITLLIGKN